MIGALVGLVFVFAPPALSQVAGNEVSAALREAKAIGHEVTCDVSVTVAPTADGRSWAKRDLCQIDLDQDTVERGAGDWWFQYTVRHEVAHLATDSEHWADHHSAEFRAIETALARNVDLDLAYGNDPDGYPVSYPAAHVEEEDGCDHGATGKPCRPDPSTNGKDCEVHGNHGGVNEDHCDEEETPSTTTSTTGPVGSTTTTTSVTPEPTTTTTTTGPVSEATTVTSGLTPGVDGSSSSTATTSTTPSKPSTQLIPPLTELPRTGTGTALLAGIGGFLLALGLGIKLGLFAAKCAIAEALRRGDLIKKRP